MDPPPEALVTTATHGAWDGMSSERRRFCSPGRRGTLLQRKSQAHPPTSHCAPQKPHPARVVPDFNGASGSPHPFSAPLVP